MAMEQPNGHIAKDEVAGGGFELVHCRFKPGSPGKPVGGDGSALFYMPITPPAIDRHMNRRAVGATIFTLMTGAVLSVMTACLPA